ncbi:hypothetical protein [Mesorhizobium huakuii]|uniref:Uncharacterized protein n=1 Tax=Mesorhizobium huakuii TaxID=28104 RepID=A0A7G6T0U2_9HYPH|nr:hypothetical protein [Mesorhizobium huakuii]QND60374.1 hypothetical protein HB778_30380 [Mesorhizobium huakuii]
MDAAGKTAVVAAPVAAVAAARPVQAAPTFPQYTAPADAKAKLDEIDAKLAAIDLKFDEGELTAVERRAQTRPLEDSRADIREAVNRATVSKDTQDTYWRDTTVPNFLAEHKEYNLETNPTLYRALDQRVRELQTAAAAEGKHRDPNILIKAHESLQNDARALLGVAPPKPGKPTPTPAKPARVIPPSLAHVPASENVDIEEGNDFAWLDRLSENNTEAFQQALSKLSAAEQERYLAQ